MNQKNKGGRPRASRVQKKSRTVTVRHNALQYDIVRHRARAAGCRTLAEYVREASVNAEVAAKCFEIQAQLNPRVSKPVGRIAISFKPEDKPRLSDEFMAQVAKEYMEKMGIKDTQYVIVRIILVVIAAVILILVLICMLCYPSIQ